MNLTSFRVIFWITVYNIFQHYVMQLGSWKSNEDFEDALKKAGLLWMLDASGGLQWMYSYLCSTSDYFFSLSSRRGCTSVFALFEKQHWTSPIVFLVRIILRNTGFLVLSSVLKFWILDRFWLPYFFLVLLIGVHFESYLPLWNIAKSLKVLCAISLLRVKAYFWTF